MFHSILSEPAEYFNVYFCTPVSNLQIPILGQPVVINEIHSYLQNPNSIFFLIYAYDYRQHTTSPSFTYSMLKNTTQTYNIQFPIHTPSLVWIRAQIIQYHRSSSTHQYTD